MIRFTKRKPKLTRRHVAWAGLAACIAFGAWARVGPLPSNLLDDQTAGSTVVVDRHGVPLYEALSGDATRNVRLTADQLPPLVVAATLAVEDRRFWSHPGVDPIALMRALKVNLAERRIVEGGSTISQQVAKLLLTRQSPGRQRRISVKVHEALIALRLEHRLSKRDILALYLNHAGYANQIVGIERASRAYFGTSASMLTPAQAAFLAGLTQRPSRFNPYRHRDLALSRQRTVLRRMAAAGALSPDEMREALDEQLTFTRASSPFSAPHFVAMVLADTAEPRPARIETTLDADLQSDVTGIIESHRNLLKAHGAHNVAAVVLDNVSGEWLAWEGSGDYSDSEHGGTINGPTVPRQPGSALKPFTYALAFEEGHSPSSVLADVPSHFPTAEQGIVYSPRNYDGRYRGPLLARRALAGSQNVPAVALASELGVPKLLRFLSRAGFTTFEKNAAHYGLGVTLGNAEVRLDELVAAYSAIARGGVLIAPTPFARNARPAPSAAGEVAPKLANDPARPKADASRQMRTVVSPRTAFWISDILADADAREYVFGRGGYLEFPFPVAVKTGTSQAYHDNWTVGYSRRVTIGVWVGNFDRTPLRNSSGVTGAAPIFHAVMLAAERRLGGVTETSTQPVVARPRDVRQGEICALSGAKANPWCPSRQLEWLPSEMPSLPCSWHHQTEDGVLTMWPAEFRQWASAAGEVSSKLANDAARAQAGLSRRSAPEDPARANTDLSRRSSPENRGRAKADAAPSAITPALRISNPPAGAIYLIDPTLRREFQTLALKVVTEDEGRIDWIIDDVLAGWAPSDSPLMWPLSPGRHRIVAKDMRGRVAETSIVVR